MCLHVCVCVCICVHVCVCVCVCACACVRACVRERAREHSWGLCQVLLTFVGRKKARDTTNEPAASLSGGASDAKEDVDVEAVGERGGVGRQGGPPGLVTVRLVRVCYSPS
jgi:hypothetical protein